MKKGFTLIELLMVIVIVGLLVTVALPKYKMSLERGRGLEAFANAAAWSDAVNAYYISNYNSYGTAEKAFEYASSVAPKTTAKDFLQPTNSMQPERFTVDAETGTATVTIIRNLDNADKVYKIQFVNKDGEIFSRACLATADSTAEKYCHAMGANTATTGGWSFD